MILGVLAVRVWPAVVRFSRHGLVRFWAFQLSGSGPFLGIVAVSLVDWSVLAVTVWSVFVAFQPSRSGPLSAFQLSCSGPLFDVSAVTVWSAFGRFSCHGLLRFVVF